MHIPELMSSDARNIFHSRVQLLILLHSVHVELVKPALVSILFYRECYLSGELRNNSNICVDNVQCRGLKRYLRFTHIHSLQHLFFTYASSTARGPRVIQPSNYISYLKSSLGSNRLLHRIGDLTYGTPIKVRELYVLSLCNVPAPVSRSSGRHLHKSAFSPRPILIRNRPQHRSP